MKLIAVMLSITMLSGCALIPGWESEQGITVFKKAQPRTPLNLADPAPIKPSAPRWIIVTPENQARVFEELRAANVDQVLFALTDEGYEELAIDFAATRNFLAHQREMLKRYREYYEPAAQEKK